MNIEISIAVVLTVMMVALIGGHEFFKARRLRRAALDAYITLRLGSDCGPGTRTAVLVGLLDALIVNGIKSADIKQREAALRGGHR